MKSIRHSLVALLILASGGIAHPLPLGDLAHDGPPTPEQISLYLPVNGTLAATATASVRFMRKPNGVWFIGHPLFRIRPKFSLRRVPDAFAGVITGLESGATYSVEVTVSDGETEEIKALEHTTRRLPPATGAATKKVAEGSAGSQIQAIFNSLKPGDVLEFANGIYDLNKLNLNRSGTSSQPIIIRGESRKGAVLRAAKGRVLHLLKASYIVIEQLTLEGSGVDSGPRASSEGVRFWSGASHKNVTIRNITIRSVDRGIVAAGGLSGTLIYDCTLLGNNAWAKSFLESNRTWNDDGIQIPGAGNAAFNNTLSGFGDSFAVQNGVKSRAIHFYRNEVLMTGDDAFEGDYAFRNITFYDNRIRNSMTLVSFDPLRGGPAFVFRNIDTNVGRQPYKLNNKNTGFFFYNNTVLRTKKSIDGNYWGWIQPNNGPLRAWGYCNNILIARGALKLMAMEPGKQDPIDFTNNAWFPDGSVWWTNSGGSFRSLSEARDRLPPTTPIFGNSIHRHDHDLITVSDPFETPIVLGQTYLTEVKVGYVPVLAPDSSLRNAGIVIPGVTDGFSGKAPDIGAIISGRPLPQWGDRTAESAR